MTHTTEPAPQAGARSGRPVQPSNRAAARATAKQKLQRDRLVRWLIAGVGLAAITIAVLVFLDRRSDAAAVIPGGPGSANEVLGAPVFPSSLVTHGMVVGQPKAPIKVVWYGDYKNTESTLFARNSLSSLLDQYVENGRIRFEYQPFPVTAREDGTFDTENEAFRAAEAAMCANDQGMFWPFNGALYANTVGETISSFSVERIKRIGEQTPGLDTDTFNACVDGRAHTGDVLAAANVAIEKGVETAPSFNVNGQPVVTNDLTLITQAIEMQLAGP
jgi:protein-disulfide isomerase